MKSSELQTRAFNGWMILVGLLLAGGGGGFWLWHIIQTGANYGPPVIQMIAFGLALLTWIFLLCGFFTLQPNIAAVLTLFGNYRGSVREPGFHWANPLMAKKKVSLRAHNLNGQKLKVNDLRGNPIEIATVVVWRVVDTAQAVFDVEDFVDYVHVQSEAALRHLAMSYPYDVFEGDTLSLRGSVDEISNGLLKEVQERVARAGVLVEEARISHLAYAPEIASAMLQRQQADAIVSARTRIVDGAVGMVEMALEKLEDHKTLALDEERRAAMVSNLLVVLCGHSGAQPVVNAGTLYT